MRSHRIMLIALFVTYAAVASSTAGCSKGEPQAASENSAASATVAPKPSAPPAGASAVAQAVDGSTFSALFPAAGPDGTTERVDRTPKQGSAEVTYKKGKDEYVTLLISDTSATPAVRDDYKSATDTAGGYPLKTSGANKSAILVANRFEVTASSPRLKPEERTSWLNRVDLAGLARLAK